jgi:excisionase family DNA binding protein
MEAFYTVEQIAEQLQVTPRIVREWLRTKRLRGLRAGRQWRVKAGDLDTFLEEPGQPTASAAPPPPMADGPLERRATLVRRVQALHKQGLTLRAIAQRLNDEGVPTISGKGRWQQGTIGNLLAQAH